MDKKDKEEFINCLRNGSWLDEMSEKQNLLLADFLKKSMAKERKKVALAEPIKDGVVYAVYKVNYQRKEDKIKLTFPGEIFVHKHGEELPSQILDIPRLAFQTLHNLGEIVE